MWLSQTSDILYISFCTGCIFFPHAISIVTLGHAETANVKNIRESLSIKEISIEG